MQPTFPEMLIIKGMVFFQRGSGKSTPHACLDHNTIWDLLDDIEKLREHLDIPEWQVRLCPIFLMEVHNRKLFETLFLLSKNAGVWWIMGKHTCSRLQPIKSYESG